MRNDERGTALIELTWLGILMLIPLTYVVITAFQVQREAFAVAGAARAAARAYSLAEDDPTGRQRAQAAANQVMADHDLPPLPPGGLALTCSPDPACASPEAVVTARVHSAAKVPLMPRFMAPEASQINVSSTHAVPLGRFRELAP